MFKKKIAVKLSLNFALALTIFSVIISAVFIILFRNHTLNINKAELEKHANIIAGTLSDYWDPNAKPFSGNGMGGYGAYIRFIGDIAGTDVWVVDSNKNLITKGKANSTYTYSELPQNAENIINDVFSGKTIFSKNFSSVLSEPTLTAGVPIKDSSGGVIGAVLLHSPINGADNIIRQGVLILITSILIGLIISVFLSILFSYSFTKPLSEIKSNVQKLAEGEYTVKNNVKQDDEIGETAAALDILSDRLYNASLESAKLEQMRRDFVANISHELKTPVTVIRGSLEAITEKVVTDPEKINEYELQMLSEAKFLQRLIGDLLDLSKLQNPDFVIEKSKISLCDIVDDAVRSAKHFADKKHITINSTKDSANCIVFGDYGRLRQMLLIVLDNAVKFSGENSTVEISLHEDELSVEDHGIGIEEKHLPYIFDRFYKSPNENNKSGTGLGLAIAKQIADRHDIKLSVTSIYGKGSKFTFRFKD